jgi:MoaA/NifB/PqqE/SkfB family radical SAM enzyme
MNLADIKQLHIELTDKCQAACPMCPRNFHGGKTRDFIRNQDISLVQFKEWFPKEFLSQLDNFYSCGNYGDPCFAKDCLEINEYVRQCNPTARIGLHTNGGMRNTEWWARFAVALGENADVIFAVDGFKGKHELYRKNTNFDKVIENMQSFINAGGTAHVDSLVFAHNENETEALETYLKDMGVVKVSFISTTRFYDMEKFEVQDNNGDAEYYIYPPTKHKRETTKHLDEFLDPVVRKQFINSSIIDPKCINSKEIYVNANGDIFPCCWVAANYVEAPIEEKITLHTLRNINVADTKAMLKDIGVPNAKHGVLHKDSALWPKLKNYWAGKNNCMTCSLQCSNLVYESKGRYD